MAVVVGAPHVDGFVKPAHGQLVIVVGDVGREIGRDAVGAHEDLVLGFLLAAVGLFLVDHAVFGRVLGAFVQDRAVLALIARAGLEQLVHHGLHRAGGVQVAFVEPHVVPDAVLAQVALQPLDVFGQGKGGDVLFELLKIAVHIGVAVFGGKILRVFHNVRALVTFLRQRAGVLALIQLQVADGQALAELFDLVARVVDIELAGHVVPGPVQAGGQAVAQRAAARVAHVHRAGRVGGDELHVVALASTAVGAAVLGLAAGGAQHAGEPAAAQKQVDEPGPRDLGAVEQAAGKVQRADDGLGNLPRRFAERARPGHCQVGSYVAVFHVGRDLHNKSGQLGLRQRAGSHGRRRGVFQQGAGVFQRGRAGVVMVVIHNVPPCVMGSGQRRFGQLFHMDVDKVAADKVLAAGIQRVAELQPPAFGPELGRDLVGRHAQRDRAEPGLVMADMPHAFFDHELAGRLAETGHHDLPGVGAQLDRRRAARIAGGLGLGVDDVIRAVALGKLAARHQLHAFPLPVLFHRALDGDEIFFLHGRHLC